MVAFHSVDEFPQLGRPLRWPTPAKRKIKSGRTSKCRTCRPPSVSALPKSTLLGHIRPVLSPSFLPEIRAYAVAAAADFSLGRRAATIFWASKHFFCPPPLPSGKKEGLGSAEHTLSKAVKRLKFLFKYRSIFQFFARCSATGDNER